VHHQDIPVRGRQSASWPLAHVPDFPDDKIAAVKAAALRSPQAVRGGPAAAAAPPLSPRATYTLAQLRFPYTDNNGALAGSLSADEAFQMLDAGRTGSITRAYVVGLHCTHARPPPLSW
jgi:hypothetical protein